MLCTRGRILALINEARRDAPVGCLLGPAAGRCSFLSAARSGHLVNGFYLEQWLPLLAG